MSFDLKAELFAIASSHEGKSMVADLIDDLVSRSDNTIDDALARAVRSGLGVDKPTDA